MTQRMTDPVATREEAEALRDRIVANACPYRGIYGVSIGRLNGRDDQWIVSYTLGSLD